MTRRILSALTMVLMVTILNCGRQGEKIGEVFPSAVNRK